VLGFTAVVLGLPSLIRADAVNHDLFVQGADIGTISVNAPTANRTTNLAGNTTAGGLSITGNFTEFDPPLESDDITMWVQLISTSNPLNTATGANTPYFDPGENDPTADVGYPFYWNVGAQQGDATKTGPTDPFNYLKFRANNGMGQPVNSFSDSPSRNFDGSTPINWTAELDLVCWDPTTSKEMGVLWSGNYGFSFDKDGNVATTGVTELAAPAWLTQSRLTAFFNGWTLGDPADCVPEPPESCALLSCGGILMLGFFRLRPKAGFPGHALAV
jgi:hypothetical protein